MTVPPTFGAARRTVVEDDVMLPRLFLAMRSPVFGSEAYYAASVCGAILGLKKGSRLYRSLVREQQIASDVSVFTFDLSKGSDLLVADVTARPDVTLEALEAGVNGELDRMLESGVTSDEVGRAVSIITTDLMVALQSAGDRADKLSMFATYLGDPSLVNQQASRYGAVTADQVNTFIRERLVAENRASLIYVPRATAPVEAESELAMAEVP